MVIARTRPARFAGWAVAAILALAAATTYAVALWKAPEWVHATAPQDRYNARVLVISVGGALVVGAGLLYTARNYRLSRRGQVTDRFTVALERLGSTELYVRIGGVHALEHVMRDSPYHHDDVIEVLTQFIRDRAPHLARQLGRQAWMHPVIGSVPDLPDQPTPDVQAALTALAHRPFRPERQVVVLTDLHLRNAVLNRANLTGAQLYRANLTGANLDGAKLTNAWLRGANLTDASLGHANLTDANSEHGILTRAWLGGANLTGVHLLGADLADAHLDGANLTDAQLYSADLTGAHLDGANLTGAHLFGADLTGASFKGADLTGAELGPDPPVVPSGWIVTNPNTGKLGRWPAGPARADGQHGAAGAGTGPDSARQITGSDQIQ